MLIQLLSPLAQLVIEANGRLPKFKGAVKHTEAQTLSRPWISNQSRISIFQLLYTEYTQRPTEPEFKIDACS